MDIKSTEDLKQVAKSHPKQVNFKFAHLKEVENNEWSRKFNLLLDECGCSSGRQYIMYASPLFLGALILLDSATEMSRYYIIAIIAIAAVIAGVAGKIAGLMQRNRKLTNLINEFLAEETKKARVY
ncbi:hypothetical protein QA597_01010 [Marinilabiliaceae bacterium ANBcel2]|nr:hypothetical protein [Marinilabiliaceae bacterium ANBcel2]